MEQWQAKRHPNYSEAYNNCGLALKEINKFQEAINCFSKAIELDSNDVEAFCNLGAAFSELKYFEDALVNYGRAIKLKLDYFQPYYNQGNTLTQLKRFDQALVSFQNANDLNPDNDFLFGSLLHVKMNMYEWSMLQDSIQLILSKIEACKKIIKPFPLFGRLLTNSSKSN